MKILSFFKASFLRAALRFDLAVACCACLTYCLIFRPTFIINTSYFGILLCGISWFVASKLLTEGLIFPKWSYYVFSIPVFFGFSYYFYSYPNSFLLIGTLFLSFIFLIFIAPFIGRPSDSDELWNFHFEILKNSIYAGIASLILLIGANLVLLALDYLFGFIPYKSVYKDTFIIISLFILPVMKLSGIPTSFGDNTYTSTGSILLKLLLYFLIPLLLVYGIILHIYSLKIMITQELPRGKVGYLVAGFEIFMLATYVLIQRWKAEHPLIRLFHRHVGWFMVTPLILMAWGLWERLSNFGLTEPRYFVALLWFWFVACTLVMLIRTLNPALWIIGILSGLFFISTIGPWNIRELPINQQIHRLKTTLLEIRSTAHKTATKEQQIIVSSILDYLNTRNRLKDIRSLYLTPNTQRSSEILAPRHVSPELGVQYIGSSDRTQIKNSYRAHYSTSISAFPIKGYSYVIPDIRLSTYGEYEVYGASGALGGGHRVLSYSVEVKDIGVFKISYNPTTLFFKITQKGVSAPIYKAYMPDLIHKLAAGSKDTLVKPRLTKRTHDKLTLQIIFTEIIGTTDNPPPSLLKSISSITCTILIHKKPKK